MFRYFYNHCFLNSFIKVVILDEADSLTLDGQKCLRNLMESYSNTARFILTGNYKHKIESSIQSRCQSLDIKPTLKESVVRCLSILQEEGIETDQAQKQSIVELIKQYFPDLRISINEIQKRCINGVFDIEVKANNKGLCNMIFYNILAKKGLDTRKYLIEHDGLFNSDWDQLLKDLLNHIYEENFNEAVQKAMIIKIAEHLEYSTRVIDKEINFFACMLNLEDI